MPRVRGVCIAQSCGAAPVGSVVNHCAMSLRILKWAPVLVGVAAGFCFALYTLAAGFDGYELSVRQFVMVNLVEPVAAGIAHGSGDSEGWSRLWLEPLLWFAFWTGVGAFCGLAFSLARAAAVRWRAHESA